MIYSISDSKNGNIFQRERTNGKKIHLPVICHKHSSIILLKRWKMLVVFAWHLRTSKMGMEYKPYYLWTISRQLIHNPWFTYHMMIWDSSQDELDSADNYETHLCTGLHVSAGQSDSNGSSLAGNGRGMENSDARELLMSIEGIGST